MWIHPGKNCKFSAGIVSLQNRYGTVQLSGALVPRAPVLRGFGFPGFRFPGLGSLGSVLRGFGSPGRSMWFQGECGAEGIRKQTGYAVSGNMRDA